MRTQSNSCNSDAVQNATLGGLLEVFGHEAFAHGVGVSDEAYAKYVGGSFAGWIDDSLWVNDQGSLNRQADVNWGKNDPLSLNYLNSNTARLSQVSPGDRDNFYGALGSLLVPLGAAALTYLGLSESTQAVIKQVDIQKVLANCTGSVCEDDATGMSIPKDTLEALLRDAVFDEVNGRLLSISGIAINAIVPGPSHPTETIPKTPGQQALDFDLPLSPKIVTQMRRREVTEEMMQNALNQSIGEAAKGKINPATRYTDPVSGITVTVDNKTGQIFQVGLPGFDYNHYNPGSRK